MCFVTKERSGAGVKVSANGDGVIPFCEPENEVLYKILQTFLRCRVFWCSLFSFLQRKQH